MLNTNNTNINKPVVEKNAAPHRFIVLPACRLHFLLGG
jgi:hypothetical protein